MFLFNTYNIANGRTITSAQLELSNGTYYPQVVMNPTKNIAKTYRNLLSYNELFNEYLTYPAIDQKSFQDLYGILYFDLRNQEVELKRGATKLGLKFQLSADPNATYKIYALVLNEEEISVDSVSGKVILRKG